MQYGMKVKENFLKLIQNTIYNRRNLKLYCSFWEPFDEEREYDRLPCVVYLHGNSSSRAEAVSEVVYLLPMNICLFAFDFSACGKSEGDYISLGWYERDDVECVIEHLRKTVRKSIIFFRSLIFFYILLIFLYFFYILLIFSIIFL